jgi:DNA-binding response OmpR family regulator
MIPQETLKELVQLRERVADLEAELADLKKTDKAQELALRQNLGVPVGETRLLLALARGGIMSREQLVHFVRGDEDNIRNVDSQIKRIRKRLPWIRRDLVSHYGYGYELEGEGLKRVRDAVKPRETRQ